VPNAIWSGAIGFGLVNVPVRLVPATRSHDLRFHQLEEGTNARIRYRRVSEASGEEVPAERIKRGYELERGRWVIVEAAEIEGLAPRASQVIEIEQFVELAAIDPLYFDTPYYLVPEERAAKPYALLVRVMEDMGRVAVGRFVLRNKQRLVAIRPLGGALCLETMRWADEITLPDAIEGLPGDLECTDRELEVARRLVEALSGPFEPTAWRDTYRDELLALIEQKAQGREVVHPPAPEPVAEVVDLVDALETSLQRAEQRRASA